MREIPRLCTDDVVRNILSGAQTQDRRPLKPQPDAGYGGGYWYPRPPHLPTEVVRHYASEAHFRKGWPVDFGPAVGARLWVRECWAPYADFPRAAYRATWTGELIARWRPSIHMPRWACRIVLPITRSWVERVQEIAPDDARAEGAIEAAVAAGADRRLADAAPISAFRRYIWEPLYPGSWERNDWVSGAAWDRLEAKRC